MKSKRWLFWLLAVVLMPALVLAAMLTYEIKSPWFPRIGLPAFDHEKAKLLSPEKRAAYEQELFSELQMWNTGSRKYPKLEDIRKREQRWQEMANDGFELAHVTLQVLQPSVGRIYSLHGPMHRLEELAQKGDVGAMCLMPGLIVRAAVGQGVENYQATSKRWMEIGAQKRHPECLTQMGGRLILGTGHFERDVGRGLDLEFQARDQGYIHGAGLLAMHFRTNPQSASLLDIKREHCWLQILELNEYPTGRDDAFLREVIGASRSDREDLNGLVNELKAQKPNLHKCVSLGWK